MRKKLLIPVLSILTLGLFGCSDSTESTTQVTTSTKIESTTQVPKPEKEKKKQEKKISTPDKQQLSELEKREQEEKEDAKKLDAKILKILSRVDTNINTLSEQMANFPSNATETDFQALEEVASSVYEKITEDFYKANELDSASLETYPNSLVQYILNKQDFAQNIKLFAKTLDQQYMIRAQERIENAEFVTSQLLKERFKFLQDNGFTEKEITKMAEDFNK